MKIELGGGRTPRGDGYVNVDLLKGHCDVQCDFEKGKLPFDDDSASSVYTSHCLEHVNNYAAMLREIARVCVVGADVEIRVPHWLHPMAMCTGHVHVLSDRQVEVWDKQPENFFGGMKKRLRLGHIHYQIDVAFHQLRPKFPQLTDEEVAKFIPACCHEIRAHFVVTEY